MITPLAIGLLPEARPDALGQRCRARRLDRLDGGLDLTVEAGLVQGGSRTIVFLSGYELLFCNPWRQASLFLALVANSLRLELGFGEGATRQHFDGNLYLAAGAYFRGDTPRYIVRPFVAFVL